MASFTQAIKVTFIFDLYGPSSPEEIAEFSVWFVPPDDTTPSNWDTALNAYAGHAYDQWAANADAAVFRSNVKLNSVKATHTNNAGHALHVGTSTGTTPWAGGGSGACLPWQISFCCGLYTYTPGSFISDAKSRRGRIFLPPMDVAVLDIPTKGTMSDSRVTDTLTWVKSTIAGVESQLVGDTGDIAQAGIISRVTAKAPRPAALFYQLTDLAADQVLDTQRRRTHQETKVRQSITYS